ncbi:MAG TPA: PDZ domain-containing protein [Candidatus Acidoferrum sp.]|nr:PDZ domain-containing protein [Candidatus Acidoferrum sp.]
MKIRKFFAIGTLAALAIGLAAGAASAQDRDSDLSRMTSDIVRQAVRAQVRQAVQSQVQHEVQAQGQLAQAISESVTNTINAAVANEVAARVNARVRVALATSLSRQITPYFAAQNPTPMPAPTAPRVLMGGDQFESVDDTGWLGVTPEDVSADRAKELKLSSARGVYLSEVEKDSPAEKAGLKSGDIITEFNGEHVESVLQFRRLVHETPSGRTVSITVWRDGRSQTLNVTMGSATGQFSIQIDGDGRNLPRNYVYNAPDRELFTPSAPRAYSFNMPEVEGWGFGQGEGAGNNSFVFRTSPTPALGVSAESVNGQLGSYFGAPEGEGVLVREVNSGSPAEKAGLKAGDVIIKIDGDRVKTVNEMQSRLREKRDAKTVQVTVMRRGSETTVTVEPTKPPTRPVTPRVNSRPISF